ncbi:MULTISPECIES: NADP-dependent oxidoreductase [Streptomyces]|uniref:NADP-dependent oxidoreductase n=1 Tax=Streptomyces TaxID=1883 RepID=UPI0016751C5A|nr:MULTISPECIES: NADP-dependent oxidoreductase [Streptomyces]MBK3527804.1 NADP-dependent oxidoreductase [Streptomyces sp. MBT70]GGR95556.1 oxidoreductase [Streptomyces eurythermus]
MKAVAFRAFGGPEVLELMELPTPEPGPGEVRVRVKAAGTQPVDCAVRTGWVPPGFTVTFPHITGGDFAGVVDALGEGVTGFSAGDEVLGFRTQLTYAEYLVVPADQIVPKPAALSWEVAGCLSASGQTAHTAIETLGVGEGETVLINGAAGGVGTIAVQLAVARGAKVIATGREENHAYLRGLGAVPVAYGAGLIDRVRAAAPEGVDAALDTASVEGLRVAAELVKDKDRVGTIFAHEDYEELGVRWIRSMRSARRLAELAGLVADGALTVHIRKTLPLARAAEAHRELETGHGRGKIVLLIG